MALVVKNPLANAGDTRDMGSIPGSGRSPGVGNGSYSSMLLFLLLLQWLLLAHSSILAWKFQGQRRLAGHRPLGCGELSMTEQLSTHTLLFLICVSLSSHRVSQGLSSIKWHPGLFTKPMLLSQGPKLVLLSRAQVQSTGGSSQH